MNVYIFLFLMVITFQVQAFTVSTSSSGTSSSSGSSSGLVVQNSQLPSSQQSGGITVTTQNVSGVTQNTSSLTVLNVNQKSPTINKDPLCIAAQSDLKIVNTSFKQLLESFNQTKKTISRTPFVVSSSVLQKENQQAQETLGSKIVGTIQASPSLNFDYVRTYSLFKNYIAGTKSPSYSAAFQNVFLAYLGLYPKFMTYVDSIGQTATPSAQAYFIQAPFQEGSIALSTLQTIMSSLTNYLTARCSLITPKYYADNNEASDVLGYQGAFQFCDAIATTLQNFMTNQFKQVQSLKEITNDQISALQNNYQKIFETYVSTKSSLILSTVLNLLQGLVAQSPLNNISASLIKNNSINVSVLEQYMVFFNAAVSALEQQTPPFDVSSLGAYKTLTDVVSAAATNMAILYSFNAKIIMANIEQSVGLSSEVVDDALPYENMDIVTIAQILSIMKGMLTKSVEYSAIARDINSNQMYSNQVMQLLTIISSWQKGFQSYQVSAYENALTSYNEALQACQQFGFVNLATYFMTMIQKINLEYESNLIKLYTTNQTYLTGLETYIQHAYNVSVADYESDQDLWCSIFYPFAGPLTGGELSKQSSSYYQGFYTLCSAASQTLQSILGSIQNNQFVVTSLQNAQLYNASQILSNFVEGLNEMLVQGSLFPDKQPADNNMYTNYYTPAGYREVYVQYQSILQNFDKVDIYLEQKPQGITNPYAPLEQLFVGEKTITSFGSLVRLHYARWAFSMAIYAISYAHQPNCSTNKLCIAYAQTCLGYALCALVDARRLYKKLGFTIVVNAIQKQLNTLKKYASILVTTAQALIAPNLGKTITSEDYYTSLYFLQCAAMIDQTHGSTYVAALQELGTQESQNVFGRSFPHLYQAYLSYKGYLWAYAMHDSTLQNQCLTELQQHLLLVQTQVKAIQKKQIEATDPAQAQQYVIQLQNLLKALATFAMEQEYDQEVLNFSQFDFVTIVDTTSQQSTVPGKTVTFNKGISFFLNNSTYDLAQLYVKEGDVIVNQLQNYVVNKRYLLITEDVFNRAGTKYRDAMKLYDQLGLINQTVSLNKKISELMALYYASIVIPVPATTSNSQSLTSSIKASQSGGGFVVKNVSKTSSIPGALGTSLLLMQSDKKLTSDALKEADTQQISFEQPTYLLRGLTANITVLKNGIDANIQSLSQQGSSNGILQLQVNRQKIYDSILKSAKNLIGSSDISNIITQVVAPLYRDTLVQGGYSHPYKSIDDQVDIYVKQLQGLSTKGVVINGQTIKASFSLVNETLNGSNNIMLLQSYIPINAVPQFSGDTTSALLLYTTYQSFFKNTTQLVQALGGSYITIPNQAMCNQIQELMNQAYYNGANSYQLYVPSIVAPLVTVKNSENLSLSDYAVSYTTVKSLYETTIAYYSALDQVQQTSGISSYDIQNLYFKSYQSYADNLSLFLVGDPTVDMYISTLKDVAIMYYIATSYTANNTIQAQLNTKIGDLYKQAGDSASQITELLPSYNGYPSPVAHNFPVATAALNTSPLSCSVAPEYSTLISEPIVFNAFDVSLGYYQQALNYYTQAYNLKGGSKGSITDRNVRVASILYLKSTAQLAFQRIALFARSAFVPINNSQQPECDFTQNFKMLISEGQMVGANIVQQMSNTSLGGSKISANTTMAQYTIMKKLLLDALIYLSLASNIAISVAKSAGAVGDSKNTVPATILGSAYVCAFNALFPSLCITFNSNIIPFVKVFMKDPKSANLNVYMSQSQLYALLYSDAFPQFGEYMWSALSGGISTGCPNIQNPDTALAVANFISTFYGITRALYGDAFLPDLAQQVTSEAAIQLSTSIDAAISAAQQSMLTNASGYVG